MTTVGSNSTDDGRVCTISTNWKKTFFMFMVPCIVNQCQ